MAIKDFECNTIVWWTLRAVPNAFERLFDREQRERVNKKKPSRCRGKQSAAQTRSKINLQVCQMSSRVVPDRRRVVPILFFIFIGIAFKS